MRVKNESKEKVISLWCDNAGEYISNEIKNWAKEVRIVLETTVPYIPEQNGIFE